MDRHLLRQKVHQRISVMKTNTGVFVVFKTFSLSHLFYLSTATVKHLEISKAQSLEISRFCTLEISRRCS